VAKGDDEFEMIWHCRRELFDLQDTGNGSLGGSLDGGAIYLAWWRHDQAIRDRRSPSRLQSP
jgi:hypothetical protein